MRRESANTETTTSNSSLRPRFSALHLLQANRVGVITEAQRFGRPRIPTHPIDNVEAHVVADRDDGIFVETHAHDDGGCRVHITVADVAGHVPLQSPLAQAAFARGFTVYGPGWTDPMFPKVLEAKLSLEHQQERLGLTISINLDAQFTPQHIEFQPVITRPESMSYAQAAERMDTDKQLQQMAQIATGIRNHYFGRTKDSRLLLDGFSGHDLYMPASSGNWLRATEMVATYMLLANRSMAEFFNQSGLPYLYRNFDSRDDNARAYYHTHDDGHDALRRDTGLLGAYGHFTSPIRRAADLLNSYMAHFALDALQLAEDSIVAHIPNTPRAAVRSALWRHGAEILRVCSSETESQPQKQHVHHAENIILNFLEREFALKNDVAQQVTQDVLKRIQELKSPLSHAELGQYAVHLNDLGRAPETRAINKKAEEHRKLENLDKDVLSNMEKKAFTALLRRAATLGELPSPLYSEAFSRITTGRHDNAQDGFVILMLASYPGLPHRNTPLWRMLKRAILRHIKHDPAAVNAIVEQSKVFFGGNVLQERSIGLPGHSEMDASDQERVNVSATILTLKQNGYSVAAPFYSVGHDLRASSSHARLAFLEHFAFGELQPVEQTSLPNVLYAELDSGAKSRRALVEEMVSQAGGKLASAHFTSSHGSGFRLEVSGGKFSAPVIVDAEEETAEIAEQSAFRRLLRDVRFKHTVAPILQVGSIMNPQDLLQNIAREEGYSLAFCPAALQKKGGFLVEVILTSEGKVHTYSGTGPNKHRALRAAAVNALEALGKPLVKGDDAWTKVRSWATDDGARSRGRKPQTPRVQSKRTFPRDLLKGVAL